MEEKFGNEEKFDINSIMTDELRNHHGGGGRRGGGLFPSPASSVTGRGGGTGAFTPPSNYFWNDLESATSHRKSCSSLIGSVAPSAKSSPVRSAVHQREYERQFACNFTEQLHKLYKEQEEGGGVEDLIDSLETDIIISSATQVISPPAKKMRIHEEEEEEKREEEEDLIPSRTCTPRPLSDVFILRPAKTPSSVKSTYSLTSSGFFIPHGEIIMCLPKKLNFGSPPSSPHSSNEGFSKLLEACEIVNHATTTTTTTTTNNNNNNKTERRGRKKKIMPAFTDNATRTQDRLNRLEEISKAMFKVYEHIFGWIEGDVWDDLLFECVTFSMGTKEAKFKRKDKKYLHLLQIIMRKCADCRDFTPEILDKPEQLRVEAFRFCSVQPTFLARAHPNGVPPKSSSFRHNLEFGGASADSAWPSLGDPVLPIALHYGEDACREAKVCSWFVPCKNGGVVRSKLKHQCFEFDKDFQVALRRRFNDEILLRIARKFRWDRSRSDGNFSMSEKTERTKVFRQELNEEEEEEITQMVV